MYPRNPCPCVTPQGSKLSRRTGHNKETYPTSSPLPFKERGGYRGCREIC